MWVWAGEGNNLEGRGKEEIEERGRKELGDTQKFIVINFSTLGDSNSRSCHHQSSQAFQCDVCC